MKCGSYVYATDSGLGILAKAFVDHGIVTDPLIIRHGRHPTHDEWYPGAPQVADLRSPRGRMMLQDHCRGKDVMLFFETPFCWEIIDHCRQIGVKTIVMPMHECMPSENRAEPDMWLCPSLLDVRWAEGQYKEGQPRPKIKFLPVPVEVPWRQRTKAEVFVHNAGHGGLKGRNGTAEVVKAIRLAKSPAKFVIRTQGDAGGIVSALEGDSRADVLQGTADYGKLWDEGDVFLFPERHNGLSLPLQEARAAGMLVMCGDRFPVNTWLPQTGSQVLGEWHGSDVAERTPILIPVKSYQKNRIGPPYAEFEQANFDPKDIAATIDAWHGKDISEYSLGGKAWAEENSWAVLGPKYKAVLEELCR